MNEHDLMKAYGLGGPSIACERCGAPIPIESLDPADVREGRALHQAEQHVDASDPRTFDPYPQPLSVPPENVRIRPLTTHRERVQRS